MELEALIASLAKTCLLCLGVVARCAAFASGLMASAAWGALSPSDLEKVSAKAEAGVRLPLAARFLDENGAPKTLLQALDGRPAVLLFVDYACKNMCGVMLLLTSRALAETGLVPGADYRLLAIGLDPDLGPQAARRLKEGLIDPRAPLFAASLFLTGNAASIAAAAAAVGYVYSPDAEHGQFAHAAAVLVVSGEGRVTQFIRATDVTSEVLSRALVGARQGGVRRAFESVRLLCYGYSPSHGLHNGAIWVALRLGGVISLSLVSVGVLFLIRRAAT